RIVVRGDPPMTVVGGSYLDRSYLRSLGAPAAVVFEGRVVASNTKRAPRTIPPGSTFALPGGTRGVCMCVGSPPSGVALLTTVRSVGLIPSLPAGVLALIALAAVVSALLAFELARVLSEPHERTLDRLIVIEQL